MYTWYKDNSYIPNTLLYNVMTVAWFQGVMGQIAAGTIDPWNTKEDAEVLFGLTLGSWVYEELFDFHIAKQNRVIQSIG